MQEIKPLELLMTFSFYRLLLCLLDNNNLHLHTLFVFLVLQVIINRQNNQKLNINNDKISGATDLQMIGLNNLAKVEGIRSNANDNAQVEFWAVTDEHNT